MYVFGFAGKMLRFYAGGKVLSPFDARRYGADFGTHLSVRIAWKFGERNARLAGGISRGERRCPY